MTLRMSGLSIAGLVAAAFLIFGRFGWLGKIAGAFLGVVIAIIAILASMLLPALNGERDATVTADGKTLKSLGLKTDNVWAFGVHY